MKPSKQVLTVKSGCLRETGPGAGLGTWAVGYKPFWMLSLFLSDARITWIFYLQLLFFYWFVSERENHQCVVPLIYVFIGWFLFVPWLGIEPTTLVYWDYALTTKLSSQLDILDPCPLSWAQFSLSKTYRVRWARPCAGYLSSRMNKE